MGMSARGILAYGFDLGGPGPGWHLQGVQKFELWRPSWAGDDCDAEIQGDAFDYAEAITGHLQHHELEVEVLSYGGLVSFASRGHVLAAWHAEAAGDRTVGLTLEDIDSRREIERWNERLAIALNVLDIRPWQPNPLTLLTQSYG